MWLSSAPHCMQQFQWEMVRSVRKAEDYHVLWIHDFRGYNAEGQPELPNLPAGQSIFYDCTTEALGADLTNVATVHAVTRFGLPVTASASAFSTVHTALVISSVRS